jgi:hypothetical protein
MRRDDAEKLGLRRKCETEDIFLVAVVVSVIGRLSGDEGRGR